MLKCPSCGESKDTVNSLAAHLRASHSDTHQHAQSTAQAVAEGKTYDRYEEDEKKNHVDKKHDGEFENCKACTERKNDNQELVKCDFCGKEVHPSKAVDRRGKVMCNQCAYDRGLEEKKEKQNARKSNGDDDYENVLSTVIDKHTLDVWREKSSGEYYYEVDANGMEYNAFQSVALARKRGEAVIEKLSKEDKQRKNGRPSTWVLIFKSASAATRAEGLIDKSAIMEIPSSTEIEVWDEDISKVRTDLREDGFEDSDYRVTRGKAVENSKPILIGGESVNVPLECLVTIEASLLERKNASRPTAPAKRYEFKFIEPGLVRYEDVQNSGNILVRKETLDRMLDSFVGKPIINMMHKECDPEAFREEADGVITRAWYNAKDGWYWAEGLVWDPATQQTCDLGADSGRFSVSCAYNPTDGVDAPAEHHNIPYEGEITNGEYTHLAIVPNPRYEAAKIFRMNSKGGPPMKLFQWLKGSKQEIDPAKSIVKNGDEEVPVTKLLEVYNSSKAGSPAAIALDAEVESEGGEKVSVSKLLEVYNASKKGPEEDEEKKKEEAAAKEEERKNAAEHFRKVEEARQVSEGGVETTIKTRDEQVAAGRAMFGSAK